MPDRLVLNIRSRVGLFILNLSLPADMSDLIVKWRNYAIHKMMDDTFKVLEEE